MIEVSPSLNIGSLPFGGEIRLQKSVYSRNPG